MRPLRLYARNFIGLREVNISFENKGLFVIQGPNGAGKSSILEAIYFALFGKTIRHDRGYEGVVNKLSSENKALVELEFLHHGKRWRVKREIDIKRGEKSSSVFLECLDTTEKAVSKRDASDKVKRLLGLTDDTFRATVLLPQGEITTFLELSETERMRVLKELLSGNKLSLIVNHVDADLKGKEGELNSYNVQLGMLDPQELKRKREEILLQMSELEAKIDSMDREIALLDRSLSELREKEGLLREFAKSREFKISLEKRRERTFMRISEINLEVENKKAREEELQKSLVSLEEEYVREIKIFEQVEEIWSKALPLRSEILSLERESKEKNAKMEGLLKDIERLKLEIEGERALKDKLKLEEENLKREYEEKREKYFIYELKKGLKVGEACPLCGAIVKGLDGLGEKVEAKELSNLKKAHDDALRRLQDKERSLLAREKDLENKERAKLELASELGSLKERLKEKEEELGRLMKTLKDKFGYDNLEDIRAKQKAKVEGLRGAKERAQRELSAVRASLLSLLDERVRLEGELRDMERELSSLNSKIAELESKLGSEINLEAVLREMSTIEENLKRLRLERDSLKQDLWGKKSRLESIDKDIRSYGWLKSKVEELEVEVSLLRELKKTLGDSKFPKFLVSHYLIEASKIANFYLSRLTRERYSIEATEDLKIFILDSEIGGERRNVRDLSGGERVLVSLSLALGIAEVLAGGLEAFFIDEGFSPLDKENLDMVAHELLELDNSGKLVGIITHDPVFADYFPAKLIVKDGMAQWA